MRPHPSRRHVPILALGLLLPACGRDSARDGPIGDSSQAGTTGGAKGNPGPADEIPADKLGGVLAAHRKGLGFMEQYEYGKAVEAFREAHEMAPGWIPGAINLAIALLNFNGQAQAEAKATGPSSGDVGTEYYDQALELLAGVLRREPENLHAHYCRGLILHQLGRIPEAYEEFRVVTERDPSDGQAWYRLASDLPAANDLGAPPAARQAATKEQIRLYEKAIARNPYLIPALYQLMLLYGRDGQRDRARAMQEQYKSLNPRANAAAPGEATDSYGEMGRYAGIIDYGPPAPKDEPNLKPPSFGEPAALAVALPEGGRWSRDADFSDGPLGLVGRLRRRFGAAVAAFDADADGRLDLFLGGAVFGPDGPRDALLLNRGDGAFEDATAGWGVPARRVSLGAAAGDFDADGRIDLYLTGVGDNRLLRNVGGRFEDVTEAARVGGEPSAVSVTARWLDLDQDGDLDLHVVRHARAEDWNGDDPPGRGLPNLAYRNNGRPAPIERHVEASWAPLAVAPEDLPAKEGLSLAFAPWPDGGAEALGGGDRPHTGVACLDLDGDRDLDLVLSADGSSPVAALNDRLGRYHSEELPDLKTPEPINGLLVLDLDNDGRSDLAAVPRRGRVALWRSRPAKPDAESRIALEYVSTDAADWRSATLADLDLDGRFDLLGLPREGSAPGWARNVGSTFARTAIDLETIGGSPLIGLALADLVGEPLPDLLLWPDGGAPVLAPNGGNGADWLALSLTGRWKDNPSRARTNPHGLGAKVLLQGPGGLNVAFDNTTPDSGPAQSVAPVVFGVPDKTVELVRLAWPDGVLQCELNEPANREVVLAEKNRKTGSCPVLFTFDGERFVCLGDFLGGGGLGYLVAPGVYSEPDRDEAVAIAPGQLRPVRGAFRLSVTEPMDEVAYLDRLTLEVVDRPPGIEAAPEERFAPGGNRPSGELLAWRRTIEPTGVTDLRGRDLGDALLREDRRTADGFRLLGDWVGYAEEHGVVLDFGDRLAGFGPEDRLVLGLGGWVEYPYSQTNYAAATAGVALSPPVLERRREDGTWEVLEADPGYPAGLPRLTLLELTGKLGGPRCVLRLRTNMECYWDRAFVAVVEPDAGLRTVELPVARAVLDHRGYTREVSPDGRMPLLYDYDHVDPAPLARLRGDLTRHGEVAELLRGDDDRLCVVGPGDEVRLEFEAGGLPDLPEGWTRGYVLRAVGYCKDADPFTAASDTIGPLPWRGMGPYPFGAGGERPMDPVYAGYLRRYQTRPTGD